jgi:hypothetical protein
MPAPSAKPRRTVYVVPECGFGPYELAAETDQRAVDRVILETINPAKKVGALKSRVEVVCGAKRRVV